jgi:hypothetical protein
MDKFIEASPDLAVADAIRFAVPGTGYKLENKQYIEHTMD